VVPRGPLGEIATPGAPGVGAGGVELRQRVVSRHVEGDHDRDRAAELAGRLGYRSEAAFARAFKRVIGVPPGAVKGTAEASLADVA